MVEQTTCRVLVLGYVFFMTVGSTLIKTINSEQTLWVSGQMKGGVLYVGLKKNLPHPAFPSNYLPVTGGKPALLYVKLNPVIFI